MRGETNADTAAADGGEAGRHQQQGQRAPATIGASEPGQAFLETQYTSHHY